MEEISTQSLISYVMSAITIIGLFVTWRKTGADIIGSLQNTVSDLVKDNADLIKRVDTLETTLDEWKEGSLILYHQIVDAKLPPKWIPPSKRKEDKNGPGVKKRRSRW